MRKKLFIQTYGCQMNEYDSEKIADLLGETHEMEMTDNPEEADVLLLNTCSVREKAQERVFHQLGRWKKLKQEKPELVIGVGGCVASQEGANINKRAPYVDLVFGPSTLHRVPQMIDATKQKKIPMVDISFPEIEKFDNLALPKATAATAYVSIMEGCSKFCTFCIVPYTRGQEVSRPFDDVLVEVLQLAEQGVREINFLGQNVNAYNGVKEDGTQSSLAELIRFTAEIDGIDRIRFTTSHPLEFSDDLIEVYNEVPKLVNHLHLPVQSGSNNILKAMKRGHTVEEYVAKLERIRAYRPNISFSSDFIVGFPGETEQDFEDTMNLIRRVGYDVSFSFVYSKRPGTPASQYEDDVSEATKKARLKILQDEITQNAARISRRMVGTEEVILVTGFSPRDPGQASGRTENNRVVNFRYPNPAELIGNFVKVEIVEALTNSLRGRLIEN